MGAFTCLYLALAITSPFAGKAVDRLGAKSVMALGGAMVVKARLSKDNHLVVQLSRLAASSMSGSRGPSGITDLGAALAFRIPEGVVALNAGVAFSDGATTLSLGINVAFISKKTKTTKKKEADNDDWWEDW